MILLCLCLAGCSSKALVEKTERLEINGFKWCELQQDGLCDAQNADGKTIIPLSREYDFIHYVTTNGGWFYVEKSGKSGACDNEGKEMIAPTKYERLSYRNEDGKEFFYAVFNDKTGICDKDGGNFYHCKWGQD